MLRRWGLEGILLVRSHDLFDLLDNHVRLGVAGHQTLYSCARLVSLADASGNLIQIMMSDQDVLVSEAHVRHARSRLVYEVTGHLAPSALGARSAQRVALGSMAC